MYSYLFICLSIYLFIYLSIYLLIYLFSPQPVVDPSPGPVPLASAWPPLCTSLLPDASPPSLPAALSWHRRAETWRPSGRPGTRWPGVWGATQVLSPFGLFLLETLLKLMCIGTLAWFLTQSGWTIEQNLTMGIVMSDRNGLQIFEPKQSIIHFIHVPYGRHQRRTTYSK